MIISYIMGGIGNQLYQYAAGRRLAHKWNTELKLDLTFYEHDNLHPYALNFFNIDAAIATPEEIATVKNSRGGVKAEEKRFMPEVLNYPDNVWLHGYWQHEKYFADIRDILLKEFTLKNALSAPARRWREKILAAECSVAMHVRHGDYVYQPQHLINPQNYYVTLPPEYYHECLNVLRQQYKNLTAFVFSDNLNWCQENLRSGVPTEFVEGEGLQDFEELWLMSLCKHNIRTKSTFSWWGAWLNQYPDKKIFTAIPAADKDFRYSAVSNEDSPLDSDKWIKVPFRFDRPLEIKMRPYFSLLLVVNDDAATLGETLANILTQDYKYFELIIIDNASTDGSGQICRQIANANDKITLIKLWNKISDGAAYNKALDLAQGDYVMFLKGNDRMFENDALSALYLSNEHSRVDVVNSVAWLREDARGGINLAGRKFALEADAAFRGLQDKLRGKFDKPTLFKILAVNGGATPLAQKVFKRDFLADKKIRFDEHAADAIQMFAANAMLQADEMIFTPQVFYIAPRK